MAHLAEFTVNDKVVQEARGKFKSNNNTVRLTGKSSQFSIQKLLWLIFGFLIIHKVKKTRCGSSMDFLWIFGHYF